MMMRCRTHNWQSALAVTMAARSSTQFSWGTHDCCMFACDCVLAATGHDPASGIRGTYRSAAGAAEVLAAHGGIRALADARLGSRVDPAIAQVGDIVLVVLEGRDTLAVCAGEAAVAPGAVGLVSMPMSAAVAAWRCTRAG